MSEIITKNSRSKLAIINVIFGIAYQVVNTVSSMVLPPLIISYFGSSTNGLLAAIKQILSYAQLFGAGVSSAAMQELYAPLANGDKKKVSRMTSGVAKSFNRAGIFFTFSVFIISGVYPLFIKTEDYYQTLILVVILGAAGVSEFFFIGKYRTILSADQRGYIISLAQSIGAALNVIVGVVILLITKNIVLVQLGCTVAYILRIIIPAIYVKRKYKYLSRSDKPDMSVVKKRKDVVVHVLMGSLTLNSQVVILSLFVSLAQASVYAVYNLVFYGLYLVLSSVSNTITASIGSLIVTSSKVRIQNFYDTFEGAFFIMLFIIYTTTAILLFPFIHLYVDNINDANYLDSYVAFLFIITGILNAVRVPAITMINASGHFKETKRGAVVETVICVTIQLTLVHFLNIYGVLLGTIFALVFRSNQLMIYTRKIIINGDIKKMYGRLLLNAIFSIMIIIFYFRFISLPVYNWLTWVVCALCIFISNSILFIAYNLIFDRKTLFEAVSYFKNVKLKLKYK